MKMKFMVPEITPNSSLHDLTLSLLYSFQETEQKLVEDILTTRENVLNDQIKKYKHIVDQMLKEKGGFAARVNEEKMKEKCDVLEQEGELKRRTLEEEVESVKEKCDVLEKQGEMSRKVLEEKVERLKEKCEELMHVRVEFEEKMKKQCGVEKEGELNRRIVESLKEKCEELKKGSGLMENMLSSQKREMEEERRLQREMLENQNDVMQKGFKKELEKMRECHDEEMERNHDVMEKKLSLCVFEKLLVEKKLEKSVKQNEEAREELEGRLEKAREVYEEELKREIEFGALSKMEVEKLMLSRVEFEEKMKERYDVLEKAGKLKRKVLEEEVESLKEKCEELERNYYMVEKKFSLGVSEKLQLEKELEKSQMQNEEAKKESKMEVENFMQSRVEFEEKMKEKVGDLAKEGELKRKVLEEEVESLREQCEYLMRIKVEFEEKMKEKYDALVKEGELKRKVLEGEVKSLKEKCVELEISYILMKNSYSLRVSEKLQLEKELKKSLMQNEEVRKESIREVENLMQSRVEFVEKMKEKCNVLSKEGELKRKGLEAEVACLKEKCEELERNYDIMKKKHCLRVSEKLQLENELKKSLMQNEEARKELKGELEKVRKVYEDELKRERDLCEDKVSSAEMQKEKLTEFDERLKVCNEELKKFEEIMVKREKDLTNEIVKREEVERERDLVENKFSAVETEKRELVERLRKELEDRIGELEGENLELRNQIELSNEASGKEFAMVEEQLAKLKGVFDSGNAKTDGASGKDYHGPLVSVTDSHHKASNLESFQTESCASSVEQSFKTPQLEGRGSKGVTTLARLEVKTESSFPKYVALDGGCSEDNINCKRKRGIYETEDEKDSTALRLLESGCKKVSLPVDFFRKVEPDAPGDSKAISPPKFSSTCVEQCKDENARHQNSELHFKTPFLGVVDETSTYSRGNPHEASPANKAAAGFRSDKEIRWKHKVDMLTAFENDPELCLAAVCALYRQTISENIARNSYGFKSSDSVRCTGIAKYLINNEPANKLSRSLLEVEQNRKNLLRSCQRLAIQYGEQLFAIYRQELDPFFCPKS